MKLQSDLQKGKYRTSQHISYEQARETYQSHLITLKDYETLMTKCQVMVDA